MNLKVLYKQEIRTKLNQKFNYQNPHQIPKLEKIIINSGLGLNGQTKKFLENAIEEFRQITGQHPVVTKAKKSIAGFKIREGMTLGLKVTLRNKKMYSFLEKFIKLVLPRIRDFRGLNSINFDKFANYHIGIREQLVFPEIDYDTVEKTRGLSISLITTATTKKESFFLLKELGLPFALTNT